ncbi:MAG: hypothetical protein K2J39_12960 [Ruminococcus sp.]|nr:hypothetical protein [Ruminococcus sp.]
MKNILCIELRKSLKNKLFILSVIMGFTVSFLSFLYNYELYTTASEETRLYSNEFGIIYNPMLSMNTLYNSWVGGEAFTLGTTVFFFIIPILTAIPYGWSYCSELKSGYIKNVVTRCGKMQYFISKYIATFISGGLAVAIPLICNFILTASFIPAYQPQVRYMQYYGIFSNTFLSEVFYRNPVIYILIYIFIDFIFCGLIACLSCTSANIIKNKVVAMLTPFGVLLLFNYIADIIKSSRNIEASPMNFLRPCPASCPTTLGIIITEMFILFIITIIPMIIRGKRYEIY